MSKHNYLELETKIVDALKEIYDPEIPVNIYDLGLIYEIIIDEKTTDVQIKMTLTSPNCPVAESLPIEVHNKVKTVEGVNNADVKIVFDPPWNKEMISEEAKLDLGLL